MRTRNLKDLNAQFDGLMRTYGYDNPWREVARQIYMRYKYNIMHTENVLKWLRELRSMLTKNGRVLKRFENAYKETYNLIMTFEVPYSVYGRREYEWVVSSLYHTMRFNNEKQATEYRNTLMAKYLDQDIEMYKVVKGTF